MTHGSVVARSPVRNTNDLGGMLVSWFLMRPTSN